MQLVAEPALHRLPGTAVLVLPFVGFHPPIRIGIPTAVRGFRLLFLLPFAAPGMSVDALAVHRHPSSRIGKFFFHLIHQALKDPLDRVLMVYKVFQKPAVGVRRRYRRQALAQLQPAHIPQLGISSQLAS